jgi:hypothetical protein
VRNTYREALDFIRTSRDTNAVATLAQLMLSLYYGVRLIRAVRIAALDGNAALLAGRVLEKFQTHGDDVELAIAGFQLSSSSWRGAARLGTIHLVESDASI